MQVDNDAALHIQKICQHTVVQFRCEDLQEGHRPQLPAHGKMLSIFERKTGGRNKVLGGKAGGHKPVPFKPERLLPVHAKYAVHLTQAFPPVQHLRSYSHALEVVENVRFHTLQPGLCRLDTVGVNAKGQVLGFNQPVVPPCQLVLQHSGIFLTDGVKIIPLCRDIDAAGKGIVRCHQIEEGQLKLHRTVKVVEKITPRFKDGGLVLVLAQLVIDVLKLDGLGVMGICHTADAIGPHPLIGDAVLCGLLFFIGTVCPRNGGFNLLFLCAGQFALRPHRLFFPAGACGVVSFFGKQCDAPPCQAVPAASIRHRNCWFCRGAAWGG